METIKLLFHVDRKEISYLRWITEAYDGMAFLKTINPIQAVVELQISPGCEILALELVDYLRKSEHIRLTPIEPTKDFSDQNIYCEARV